MHPSEPAMPPSTGLVKPTSDPTIVTLNVGGQIFQTTHSTLSLAGPNSFLSTLSLSLSHNPDEDVDVPFIDRDPQLFSIILSLLRTGNLPPTHTNFHLQDIILESQFYGIESILINSLNNPSLFEPLGLQRALQLPLNGRDTPSALSATSFGSVHVAHGNKITSFDWSLTGKTTILTEFAGIDSLLALTPEIAAAGATDFSGLQILDLQKGFVRKCLSWENATRSSSTVQALGLSDEYLFTSFESGRRNSNAIMVYDRVDDFRPVVEIARNEIYGAEFDAGTIPATKLSWVSSCNLLMASGSHSGPNGVVGCVKLWDVKSGRLVWELQEKADCFADVAVSSSLSVLFKVGVNSGEVYFLDLRNMGPGSQWVCLGNGANSTNTRKEGLGCKVECYGYNVFVSKGGSLELWSEISFSSGWIGDDGVGGRVFKKNLMGRTKDLVDNRITNLSFGGNKMFVTRKDQQLVEVWQSSTKGL